MGKWNVQQKKGTKKKPQPHPHEDSQLALLVLHLPLGQVTLSQATLVPLLPKDWNKSRNRKKKLLPNGRLKGK